VAARCCPEPARSGPLRAAGDQPTRKRRREVRGQPGSFGRGRFSIEAKEITSQQICGMPAGSEQQDSADALVGKGQTIGFDQSHAPQPADHLKRRRRRDSQRASQGYLGWLRRPGAEVTQRQQIVGLAGAYMRTRRLAHRFR
jgi:hypothetical protein